MGDVNSVMGASTTALSDWSATIGGTTVVIIRSESTLATTSEEARRIAGWRRTRETGSGSLAELLSAVSNITGSLDSGFSRERSLQKIIILVVDDSLENCHRFASNNDVVLPCLRVRSSNCAKKARMAQPIWLKLDEIAGTLGGIYGAVVLLNVSNWNRRAPHCFCQKWVQSRRV